jgi:hypothetical protein
MVGVAWTALDFLGNIIAGRLLNLIGGVVEVVVAW